MPSNLVRKLKGIYMVKHILKKCLLWVSYEDNITRWRRLGATIGQNVFIGHEVDVDEGFAPLLTIEDGVVVSDRTVIMLHDSAFNNLLGLPIKAGRVTIQEDAYIGVNTTILCGVTIGRRALVGAGSLVIGDVPDESVAFGCPAVLQGTLAEYSERYQSAISKPGRFEYWDIIPWRDRQRKMLGQEIESARRAFINRFGDSSR